MAGFRYELVAIDLDGTLLDGEQRVSQRNREALHAAHEAGLKLVLCTGRSYTETRRILDEIGLDLDATITVGGALISDAQSGNTLASVTIEDPIARRALQWFAERGFCVMWLVDRAAHGHDGYFVESGRIHPALERWFKLTPCEMARLDELPAEVEPTLRVTVVDEMNVLSELSPVFRAAFTDELTHNVIEVPAYRFTVIESFAAPVTKWSAIQRLCARWGIAESATAAIGDDTNDLPMIASAGLGVAVGNAKDAVKSVAQREVTTNEDGGVAELLEHLLMLREG